jgi:succinate dehydrogenase/fumarate reductase flavoprotein subunit
MSGESEGVTVISRVEMTQEGEMAKEAAKRLSRKEFVKGAAVGAAGAGALGAVGALAGCGAAPGEVGPQGPVGSAGPAGPAGPQGDPAIPVIAEKELTCDVVVVGGGTSGMTAAAKAALDGAEVIVIEKRPNIGGEGMVSGNNAALGGGTEYQKAAGIEDNPELFFEERSKWDPKADPEVLKAYCSNAVATVNFLRDAGVNWVLSSPGPTVDLGDSFGRTLYPEGRGPALYAALRPTFEAAGGKILTETKGVKLLTEAEGAVVGVLAKDSEGLFKINSKATILTCGGFQGSYEMMAKYVGVDSPYALLRGLPTNCGEGVLMGIEVGAATTAMQRVHGYVHIVPYPLPYPFQPWAIVPPTEDHASGTQQNLPTSGSPLPGICQTFHNCIVVNIRGERFANEPKPRVGEQMANEILRQPEVRAYIIADQPLYEEYIKAAADNAVAEWPKVGYAPAQVETDDTIEKLAVKLKMSPSVLGSTVSEYNKAVEDGTTAELRIPKTNDHPLGLYEKFGMNFLNKIETPPFYGVHITAGISHADGGLAINGKCQVIDGEKKVIPGLYAGGDTTVLWHSNYATGYSQALCLGYIAGTNAAASL